MTVPRRNLTWGELESKTAEGVVVHVVPNLQSSPLCEKDGPEVSKGDIALDLSGPTAGEFRDTVNCPGCLAWLHA